MVCTESEDGLAVFVPHPRDCGLYYECDGTTPVLMECPPGLYWDERENVCNWPEASGCSMEFIKVTSSSSGHESHITQHNNHEGVSACHHLSFWYHIIIE